MNKSEHPISPTASSRCPAIQTRFYGHAGDGNVHAVLSVGAGDAETQHRMDQAVFDAVRTVHGSIAAEHGIGISRTPWLGWSRTPEEIALMRTLKQALDPLGILNPGKLFQTGASPLS